MGHHILGAFLAAALAGSLAGLTGAQRTSSQDHFRRCPQQCACYLDVNQGKKVSCEAGGLSDIPFLQMDGDVQVFHFTAPPDLPNEISLGRFFGRFSALEEIRITHSRVPAIGENSFYPLRKLQILDLSHNNISTLIDKDFYGLYQLKVLNLSANEISKCPSAPFRHLQSLTSLILSNNRLQLAPRLFYMLKNLQRLDLSGNPLDSIDPDILKDLRPVTRLYLARCNLSSLHSLVYQQLPNLEHLDLRVTTSDTPHSDDFRLHLFLCRSTGDFSQITKPTHLLALSPSEDFTGATFESAVATPGAPLRPRELI
ncbi:leucine-rich repeat-containing protein 15-like [Tropilaelaps mercedesae]|uniref:Leucine-rich repeat-containing protein 15-like n=1 Tax=Tropilaelaps mercedesae TaxID=418985 RepID=A0A1V9XDX6_9ACAR|nr:leucine-rich repeat-containing protein 15-like [Tropilaelaps mercedesae]